MKTINILGLFLCVVILTGCSDWLDVSPKTDIKSQDLFSNEDGFKSALTGIYGRMTGNNLYGKDLSFLFMEQLVQRYDNNRDQTDEQRATIYDYKNQVSSKSKLNGIWKDMYKNIANINNLILNVEVNGNKIETPGYYNLIYGEALGLRAFHYFDLLRMWGPVSYEESKTLKVIPWRDRFTPDKVPLMQADSLVAHILNDLKEAEKLLKDDPMNYGKDPLDPFIEYRQHRMNRFAVKALMARIYLWIGDKENAVIKAQEVIDGCGLKLVRDNQKDLTLFDETLFGLNMFNMHERLSDYFTDVPMGGANTIELWVSQDNIREVYEGYTVGINDIRYKNGYGFKYYNLQALSRKYVEVDVSNYKEKIPLIRLAEMYYILAESVTLAEGGKYINIVRNARGISKRNDLVFNSEKLRLTELQKEYQKDFFGEGQFFYFLKRLRISNFYRCPFANGMKDAHYVFPIPDDEIEYGLVKQ